MLMVGFTVVRSDELCDLLDASNSLVQTGARAVGILGEDELNQEKDAMAKLSKSLALIPAVPTATGSGRAGTMAKVHCAIHASKLFIRKWFQCASFANQIVAFTTDFG